MTTQHTPGRLKAGRHGAILGGAEFEFVNGSGVKQLAMTCVVPEGVEGDQESNARRLVACWNACEGIETEALEGHALQVIAADRFQKVYDATNLRKELLAALKDLCKLALNGESVLFTAEYDRARAAIAKVEGGAA